MTNKCDISFSVFVLPLVWLILCIFNNGNAVTFIENVEKNADSGVCPCMIYEYSGSGCIDQSMSHTKQKTYTITH